jgi:hypothetical protein
MWQSPKSKPKGHIMNTKTTGQKQRRTKSAFVVARASAATWVVAFSRKVIPGGVFKTKDAALEYASTLARAAGLRSSQVTVLG